MNRHIANEANEWGAADMFNRFVVALCAILAVTAIATRAQATTITVNTAGGPSSTRCNLTDAVQAATTNTKVHGCPAGQTTMDTIKLAATTYQNYGTFIAIPEAPNDGGPLQIVGAGSSRTFVLSQDYGMPSGEYWEGLCGPYDSAVYSAGSSVALSNLSLSAQGSAPVIGGICHAAGNLTVSNANIGYAGGGTAGYPFQVGAILSTTTATQPTPTLALSGLNIFDNGSSTYAYAGGVSLFGTANTTIVNSEILGSAGGVYAGALVWTGGGSLSISGTSFNDNVLGGDGGGALWLGCYNSNGCPGVTLSTDIFQGNVAGRDYGGDCGGASAGAGIVFADPNSYAPVYLTIDGGAWSLDNYYCNETSNRYTASLDPSWQAYFMWCQNSASMYGVSNNYSQWAGYLPIPGDGTCQFMP